MKTGLKKANRFAIVFDAFSLSILSCLFSSLTRALPSGSSFPGIAAQNYVLIFKLTQ
jgi:hypothetical protein